MDKDQLMTAEDLAAYLQVPRQTVYSWRHTGRIPAAAVVKVNRLLRFDRAAVEAWLQEQQGNGGSSPRAS